ncbi:MAG: 30S ribosomal protein S3 [Candidatus Wildermuthbacteria bacterium]|nr:30S ribosomal protein S3 [Candidatus Wildermuthbacteria bacterium]
MAHKVHPKSFRIHETKDWVSRWFDKKTYQESLKEDFKIREVLEKRFKEASVESMEIERFSGKLTVIISTSRPGLLIGRGGSGIEEIKKAVAKEAGGKKKEIKIEIRELKNPWEYASLTGAFIASQIEKRMPFRQVMKQTMSKVMASKGVEGVRIEMSGRLGGAEIARREWMKKGRMPRQTLRADIQYALTEALTRYGTIGIKVWIYKGEKFE